MEFKQLLQQRYSVRGYRSDPVEAEKLNYILEAARLAPTAANRQPIRIMVAQVKGNEKQLSRLNGREWFVQAPLILCVCGLRGEAWVRECDKFNTAVMDASIVMTHIILSAADVGLGTCWVGSFNPVDAREVFQLPDDVEPVALTPLGYPAIAARAKDRKPVESLVRYGRW